MSKENASLWGRALLPLGGAAVAIGAFFGLPALKALASSQEMKVAPIRPIVRPPVRLNMVQGTYVNPSAKKLVAIADEALANSALMERIFQEPDAVAAQYNLTDHEKLVLRNMTREQFEVARGDAMRVSQSRLSQARPNVLPAIATDPELITGRMVVGRAILAAVGRSYLDAANAHGCCPWGHAIELGVNPSRVFYDEVFRAPARMNVPQPSIEGVQLQERG